LYTDDVYEKAFHISKFSALYQSETTVLNVAKFKYFLHKFREATHTIQ